MEAVKERRKTKTKKNKEKRVTKEETQSKHLPLKSKLEGACSEVETESNTGIKTETDIGETRETNLTDLDKSKCRDSNVKTGVNASDLKEEGRIENVRQASIDSQEVAETVQSNKPETDLRELIETDKVIQSTSDQGAIKDEEARLESSLVSKLNTDPDRTVQESTNMTVNTKVSETPAVQDTNTNDRMLYPDITQEIRDLQLQMNDEIRISDENKLIQLDQTVDEKQQHNSEAPFLLEGDKHMDGSAQQMKKARVSVNNAVDTEHDVEESQEAHVIKVESKLAVKETKVDCTLAVEETKVDCISTVEDTKVESKSAVEETEVDCISTVEDTKVESKSAVEETEVDCTLSVDQNMTSTHENDVENQGNQMIKVECTAPLEEQIRHDEQTKSGRQNIEEMKPVKAKVQPLTIEQLQSLYVNEKLEANVEFIKKLVETELRKDYPEFYEILLNYQRARKSLQQTEEVLCKLEQRYKELEEELWITEVKSSTVKGVCGDNARCTKTISYEQARLNDTALTQLTKTLDNMKQQIQFSLCLHSYSSLLSRLQVESFLHNLIVSSPVLYEIPRNVPIFGCERHTSTVAHQVVRLRMCISVLFTFHRTPIDDEEMLTNLQKWTERLVSFLLRIGTYEDHLFIINHLMRCPAGVGAWAANFIQTPPIPTNENLKPLKFGNLCVDHVITALATVLMPTCGRKEFLCEMQKVFTPCGDKKGLSWVLVDEDGEEDEDPQNAWLYLHENDIVAFLRQIPLADIFRHVFFITQSPYNESLDYRIEKTEVPTMYRVYSFCTCFVRLLGTGMRTYNMARYRQLNKRLGRMIRQTVQYTSDHWGNFRDANRGLLPVELIERLQLEFDAFFLRAVDVIHTAQRLGSWQFIADMPFNNISKETMWKLLWLLYQGNGLSIDVLDIPSLEECVAFVTDSEGVSQLGDILQHVPVSEGVYLLNTMTNMTEVCSSADLDIIETVTMAVFEVSYICPQTRDSCSKMGRELLSAVVKCHPFILSKLLQIVHVNMEKLGPMGLYLYKGLPLHAWLPSDPDLVILRQWLLNSDLGSKTHLLAQLVISNINWSKSQKGDRLMVPWKVHKHISILIVEAYQKFIMGKHLGSVIMEGVKQVSAAVQQYSTREQEFNGWCWDLLIKLSLHRSSLPPADQRLAEMFHQEVLDLNKDDSLLPLVKGNKEKNATACFVTLLLTKYGHSETEFISNGIPLLQVLVDQGLSKPSVCVLYYVVPLFVEMQPQLVENSSFQLILSSLLQSDESYFKLVKGLLSYDFPGPITKLLTSMLMGHIEEIRVTNNEKMLPIIGLLVKLLMKYQKWYQDRNYCYVLDQLIAASFTSQSVMEGVQRIIQDFYKEFCDEEKSHGVVSSFVNWVTSGTYLPSFLENTSCPEFPWLAYTLLCLEGNYELTSQLWETIQGELLSSSKVNIDQALKKAKNRLKLDQAPTSSNLSLYRFAHQALDVPVTHSAAVLTWQRFFIMFLGRMDTTSHSNSAQRGSVGEKFFTGLSYYSMRKKLKKRLKETSDYYMKCTAEADSTNDEERNKKDMYNKLARIFQTFELWVEEPLLHDATLYLPSLPPQYMADRLLTVFQKNTTPWFEFINTTEIEESMVTMATEWKQSHTQTPFDTAQIDGRIDSLNMSGKERILTRIQRCEKPLPPPPVHPVSAPVPDVSPALLEDKTALLHLLHADMEMLKQHAGQFCSRMAKQETLDDKYVRLIPDLYKNETKEKVVSLECSSMINPLHRCSKPGSTVVKFAEKCNNPVGQRQADENRMEYKQVMMTNKLPPPQNLVISAVHTENTITMLVKLYRMTTDESRLQNINNIACSLFFLLGDAIDSNIQSYPPTQQFFSSCIEVLGQNFIENDMTQTDRLLEMAISHPDLGGLLSPHFVPNINHRMFGPMYSMLLKPVQNKHHELTFMLLTKFDVKKWLTEYQPSKQEVQKFVETLGQALCMCGVDPDEQQRLVFGQYIGHEKMVLRHKFPQNIHEILAALLQGSSVDKLSETCWTTFLTICFYGNQCAKTDEPVRDSYPDVFTDLSTEQITNIIQWLGHEFMQIRLNQKEVAAFGLYPRWKRYVSHLANLLRDLSKCLVDKMIPTLMEATSNECIDSLWSCIAEGFGPWIQTIYISSVPGMPWIQDDCNPAVYMVKALKDVVGFAHFKTLEIRGKFYNDFLSLLWLYFATTLCKADVSPWVISVLNLEFQQLPWKHLFPNIQVMETLVELKENGGSLGFNLVSDIISEIEWPRVTDHYTQNGTPDIISRYEGCLFLLLIQACAEKKYIENPDMENLLSQAEFYKWQNLSPDIYKKSCSWFLHDSDSKCIILGRSSPEGFGVRLLKSASGFTTEVSQLLTEDWAAKRQCYLHTLSALVCQVTFLPDWQPDPLKTLIVNLLTEIETVESAVVDVYTQHQECTDMVKEILTLLNNCNPDNQASNIVMETWMEWLRDSPQTILLSPCIHAATRSVASLTYMVQIVELCIELTFIPGGQRKVSDPWTSVLSALQIPELNLTEFFRVCLQESAFLFLHCYILQRVPLCQTLAEKQGLIEVILDWMDRAKPSTENESKLLLWWHKVLDLILQQLDYGADVATCVKLLRKCINTIQIFGEERMSGGLLGAIGFGKKSLLTDKFRVCSRAVVGFLSQQIVGEDRVRVSHSVPTSTNVSTKQNISALLSLKSNKKYQPIKMEVEMICEFVRDQSKCLGDVILLVKSLRTCFYSEHLYLAVIDSISV